MCALWIFNACKLLFLIWLGTSGQHGGGPHDIVWVWYVRCLLHSSVLRMIVLSYVHRTFYIWYRATLSVMLPITVYGCHVNKLIQTNATIWVHDNQVYSHVSVKFPYVVYVDTKHLLWASIWLPLCLHDQLDVPQKSTCVFAQPSPTFIFIYLFR